jgi:hypothetical protein
VSIESDAERGRVRAWAAPPRPQWVQQINDEGRHLDLEHVVPLDSESLLAAARASTGLEDFCSDEWREPFTIYLDSLRQTANLTLIGRLMTRSDLLTILEARLRIERCYKDHPEIDDQEIAPSLFIIGLPRTGTSMLQNLLTTDPDNGAVLQWEAMFPCPHPKPRPTRATPGSGAPSR